MALVVLSVLRETGGGGGMKMESVSSHCVDSTVYFDRVSGQG